ncbi:MAG: hypothetical protein HC795_16170 [Coleofasciculaceae cyanobacterium RL_1_1]|nr:hypothetical protein [Coleofasciculaceae cyanobacterium RL_1_1]
MPISQPPAPLPATPLAIPPEATPPVGSVGNTPLGSTSVRQWDESEITNAAQQLANFFGGEVVTLDEDVLN